LYSFSLFVLLLVTLIYCASFIDCCCFGMRSIGLAFIGVGDSFGILRLAMSMRIMRLFCQEIQGIWILEHLNSYCTCISLSINFLCNFQCTEILLEWTLSRLYSIIAVGSASLCQNIHPCSFLPVWVSRFHRYRFASLFEDHHWAPGKLADLLGLQCRSSWWSGSLCLRHSASWWRHD